MFAGKRQLIGLALLWALTAHSVAAPTDPRALLLVNAPYPPFVNSPEDPSGEGIDIDIAREAMKRGGNYKVEVQIVPWNRALMLLERGQADFTTTISRNGDRDRFLLWSQGYRQSIGYNFYARKGSGLSLKELSDLDGRTLGISAGFFYPEGITKRPGVRIETGNDIASTVKKLNAGRSDFIVVNAIAGAWEIRRLELSDQLEKQPYTYSSTSPTYMAFSRERKDSAAYKAMKRGLAEMMTDGSIRKIEQKYLK